MVVEVNVEVLQTWIIIGLTVFTGICTLTTIGIKIVTKPMVTALKELNTTVKVINDTANNHELRIQDIETIHRLNGCDQPKRKKGD